MRQRALKCEVTCLKFDACVNDGYQALSRPGNKRSTEIEDHEKQHLATLKRLKRGDDNELERNLSLEVVARKPLRLAVEIEEERRAKLENNAATKRLRLAMETDEERKASWRRWWLPHRSC